MKRTLSFVLCFLLLLTSVACFGNDTPKETTDATEQTTQAVTEENGYPFYAGQNYADNDGNPAEIVILNFDSYVGTNLEFAPAETQSADILNASMVRRNNKVEEKLNVIIREDTRNMAELGGWGKGQPALSHLVSDAFLAGDCHWDIANVFLNWDAKLITSGSVLDLNSVNGLHLEKSYWDQNIMNQLTLNGKCYTGYSNFTLMPIDLTWAFFFNENLMADLSLDLPYSLVDSKEWTLSKLLEYVKDAKSLNRSGNYDFETDQTTVCSIATHSDAVSAVVISAGNLLLTKNAYGEFVPNIANEHIYNTISKVQEIFSKSQGYSQLSVSEPNSMTATYGYVNMFKNSRALFLTAEIKSSSELREMEDDFGILPSPLYDSNQESYMSLMSGTALLTLPTMQKNVERTAVVLDMLSYYSADVMNTYITKIVTHKNLRNSDSARMMEIIRNSVTVEVGSFFEFTAHYINELKIGIRAENINPASLAENEADTIETRIEKYFEALESPKTT